MDEAIGDPEAVKDFVTGALPNLFGIQIIPENHGFGVVTANMTPQLRKLLPKGDLIKISFESPTPEGYHYIGRNHRFVEQVCHLVMSNTIDREGKRAARASVIRTSQVQTKTTLLLFRCRNVIEQRRGTHQIVAEEMFLWGWRRVSNNCNFLNHSQARTLLSSASASSNLSRESRENFLNNELNLLSQLDDDFKQLAENQCQKLVDSHERFSVLMGKGRYQVVYPVLPMDLMGIYIMLPQR